MFHCSGDRVFRSAARRAKNTRHFSEQARERSPTALSLYLPVVVDLLSHTITHYSAALTTARLPGLGLSILSLILTSPSLVTIIENPLLPH